MAVVLLKNQSDRANIIEQQNHILSYAKKHQISIDVIEIETSDASKKLEQRGELKGFLRSLNPKDTLLIYDFWVLSLNVGELVKVCECLLQRDIALHICRKKEVVDNKCTPLQVLHILAKEREACMVQKESLGQGRPKGRMSQSKFDKYRSQIISYLEQNYSVSKIAQTLNVSRTSLKDYINSRNLKNLAQTKKELLGAIPKKTHKRNSKIEKCDLIANEKDTKDK